MWHDIIWVLFRHLPDSCEIVWCVMLWLPTCENFVGFPSLVILFPFPYFGTMSDQQSCLVLHGALDPKVDIYGIEKRKKGNFQESWPQPNLAVTCITHHASHNCLANAKTKLILCHVTWDTHVTKSRPETPTKPKLGIISLLNGALRIAIRQNDLATGP